MSFRRRSNREAHPLPLWITRHPRHRIESQTLIYDAHRNLLWYAKESEAKRFSLNRIQTPASSLYIGELRKRSLISCMKISSNFLFVFLLRESSI